MRPAPALAVALLVLLAGCSAVPLPEIQTTTPSPVADECQIDDLEFDIDGGERWAPDTVRVRYRLTGSADVFLVAKENSTILGVHHVQSDGPGEATDVPIRLERNLSGFHTIRVQAFGDQNGDGVYERTADRYCEDRRGVLQTSPYTSNFSEYEHANRTA